MGSTNKTSIFYPDILFIYFFISLSLYLFISFSLSLFLSFSLSLFLSFSLSPSFYWFFCCNKFVRSWLVHEGIIYKDALFNSFSPYLSLFVIISLFALG